jgi:hypothetical protein
MPAVTAGYMSGGQIHKPSCFDRIKIGFTMGFTVGMVTGIVFGGYTALRYIIIECIIFLRILIFCICFRQGSRGRELLSVVGKSVISAGGTFGTFMAIGSAIRC